MLQSLPIRPFLYWARKIRLARTLAGVLIVAAIASGVATYSAITRSNSPFGPDPSTVLTLVLMDLIFFLALMILVSRKLIGLWLARKKGTEGSRLQGRIVLIFSVVASVPTIIVAVFSALFLNYGIQSWFDQRVSTAIEESVAVAEAYLAEHKEVTRADALAMANDLSHNVFGLIRNPAYFHKIIDAQVTLRSLTEAVVFQRQKILAQSSMSFSIAFERLQLDALERASTGEVVVLTTNEGDKVRALIKLDNLPDTYLLIGRFVDHKVLHHMTQTQGAAEEYQRLKTDISGIQIQFSIVFLIVALLLLMTVIWVGMLFASAIVQPIGRLVEATERVKSGDFSVRVKEGPEHDEIGILSRAFNRMARQLVRQRNDLLDATYQIDARRHFTEMVLSGVSSGVIAVNNKGIITLANPSAEQLLASSATHLVSNHIDSVLPESMALREKLQKAPHEPVQEQLTLQRHNQSITLLMRIAVEEKAEKAGGYIITFDDITELVSAQRRAAWSDVARRIAHEIKNPLTPIYLAAERLKRKYGAEVSDNTTFTRYTDTIMRHVGDIGKIVEEFVSFARMPSPVFAEEDILKIVQDTVFSRECIGAIEYVLDVPEEPIMLYCDVSQVTRCLTNILKNAEESIEEQTQDDTNTGKITLTMVQENGFCHIIISDTGKGVPPEILHTLTEPYVTTRTKGTGLGLAIVKKIMEDHNGSLKLKNNPEKGACVTLTFPLLEEQKHA